MATIGVMVPYHLVHEVTEELDKRKINYDFWNPIDMLDNPDERDVEITVENDWDANTLVEIKNDAIAKFSSNEST